MIRPSASDRAAVLATYRRRLGRGKARLAEFLAAPLEVSSEGSRIRTSDGRDLLDCGGYAVFLIGHGHPRVRDAVIDQIRNHPMASRVLLEHTVAGAAEALCRIAPPGLECVQFTNSGAEATELGLKIARAHGKTRLITMESGYHGKTLGALSVTPNALYQNPFRPLLDASVVPFGNLDHLAKELTSSHGAACVILEPIQGEGGVNIPPPGYLAQVQRLCQEHDAMLVVDEIQTGLGRCGRWWASQPDMDRPDVLLVGKALSGGIIPVAAVLATEQAFTPLGDDPTLHSSTFAAAPVAMAAATATLKVLEDEDLVTRADTIGRQLLAGLSAELAPYPQLVTDVRGRGLLIGIEFSRPDLVAEIFCDLLDVGLLANHSLNGHSVLRLTPPAVLDDADVTRVITMVGTAVRNLQRFAA